ncbi:hydrolase [Singulisphaera sp. PoT]|uniref:hydrolase n=1 Tax=Singulisphaera sp. PoT TaxID=3411797 RepID=UPI003BF4DCE8
MKLDPRTTALVMIDLQKGVLRRDVAPYSGAEVLGRATELAGRFRDAGAMVVWVRACWSRDLGDALRPPADKPMPIPEGGFPEDFATLPEGLQQPGDFLITKRQWGAFYGTELDLQLRRRGVQTIVLGGIATNLGVESTARAAWEHGYRLVIVEDTTSSFTAEMHDFAIQQIMPRIAIVTTSAALSFKDE